MVYLCNAVLHVTLCFFALGLVSTQTNEDITEEIYFAEKLIEKYGSGGKISTHELQSLIDILSKDNSPKSDGHGGSQSNHDTSDVSSPQEFPPECQSGWETNTTCLQEQCLSADKILQFHAFPKNTSLDAAGLNDVSASVIYQIQNPACRFSDTPHAEVKGKPSTAQVWGYGFLCVTFINLCALMGMFFLPLMSKSFYHKLLMFMVALAVGTLAGSGLLFLIPESFAMTHDDSPYKDTYIWKSTTILGGIYLFFLVERMLSMIMEWRQKKKRENKTKADDLPICSVKARAVQRQESINMSFASIPVEIQNQHKMKRKRTTSSETCPSLMDSASRGTEASLLKTVTSPAKLDGINNTETDEKIANREEDACGDGLDQETTPEVNTEVKLEVTPEVKVDSNGISGHGHSHMPEGQAIKSVAWMVIFGDGLHNFIDGLSIGAAFTQSFFTGLSVSLAVICEELPHELGDFAILLNSGMTMRQALSYNFLSACMCYIGLVVGIVVGDMTEGSEWIFAVAGGMFLYISLVDMLPEVNLAAEEETKRSGKHLPVFLLQNAGLLTGFGIMLILANYSGNIALD